jgi:hypothetical protein
MPGGMFYEFERASLRAWGADSSVTHSAAVLPSAVNGTSSKTLAGV